MKPLLAHKYAPHRITYPCIVQPKLNGVRALYQGGRFQSREELPFPEGLLDHLAEPLRNIVPPEIILDGELYVHGWSLGRILSAITPVATQRGASEDTLKVEYHVFDIVNFNLPFSRRFKLDHQLPLPAREVKTFMAVSEAHADELYAEFVDGGYEGMMYRLGECPYTIPKQTFGNDIRCWNVPRTRTNFLSDKNNRTWHLLKRKNWQDDEFLIVRFNTTIGELGESGFHLWCQTEMGKQFKVSSGLTQNEQKHYEENSPAGRQAKIKYLVLSDEGIPLNATILAIL